MQNSSPPVRSVGKDFRSAWTMIWAGHAAAQIPSRLHFFRSMLKSAMTNPLSPEMPILFGLVPFLTNR
jgi:hypothetical protein